MCDKYVLSYHKNEILQILQDSDENKHFSVNLNFVELFENDTDLASGILKEPDKSLKEWDNSLLKVQNDLILQRKLENYSIKNKVHCRIFGLPICPELHRNLLPQNDDVNKFLQVSGTVVRMTSVKLLEYQRQYICTKCKYPIVVKAEYERKNIIVKPKKCTNPENCPGTKLLTMGELDVDSCKDYQEIKIQENLSKLEVGSMPNSMWVTLEDDLVDICKPGDNITICGIVKRRWGPLLPNKKIDIELVLKTNHLQVTNLSTTTTLISPEIRQMFDNFWNNHSHDPLMARDIILKSICPQIYGLYIVKLATAMILAGGSPIQDDKFSTGVKIRAEPHLLLVGDPGTGKSELLRFASKIAPRSVLTTGVGSTAAGLTVTAVMEDGEWQLEGGALVLADGGICCIDEFNSMKEHDRTSIHEAMEQQTISVAKASIVCKLSTKCSILAATNPKGNIDSSQPLSMNIALASPLLSRFDLVLILKDQINDEWDSLICDHILSNDSNNSKLIDNSFWTLQMLQSYFIIVKKINPKLSDDSNRILSNYYQYHRRKNFRNKSRTTVRLLDSLIRLSQGHAKLIFHQEVEIIDAIYAVILSEISMGDEFSLFNLNFNVINQFPDNSMENYRELLGIILKKLELEDLLEKEITYWKFDDKIETHHKKIDSKFFALQNRINQNEISNNFQIEGKSKEIIKNITENKKYMETEFKEEINETKKSIFYNSSDSNDDIFTLDLDIKTKQAKKKVKKSVKNEIENSIQLKHKSKRLKNVRENIITDSSDNLEIREEKSKKISENKKHMGTESKDKMKDTKKSIFHDSSDSNDEIFNLDFDIKTKQIKKRVKNIKNSENEIAEKNKNNVTSINCLLEDAEILNLNEHSKNKRTNSTKNKKKSNILPITDLDVLNMFPSVNDEFPLDDILNESFPSFSKDKEIPNLPHLVENKPKVNRFKFKKKTDENDDENQEKVNKSKRKTTNNEDFLHKSKCKKTLNKFRCVPKSLDSEAIILNQENDYNLDGDF